MSDEAPSTLAAWNARIIFGAVALAFCMAIIAFTVIKGASGNTLHESAQSWSFALIGAILLGFGVGAVAEPLVKAFKK